MDRRDFLRYTSLGGLGLGLMPALLQSCEKDDDITVNFNGKVIIIGAGAAGMMAAYILQQYNIDYVLLEASAVFGGRVKKTDTFADFPIDLGAEWLHDQPSIFKDLINDENVEGSIDMISYQPEEIHFWNNGTLSETNFGSHFYREYKFKRTTWFDFFEDFIIPHISDKTEFNKVITEVDYSDSTVTVTTESGETYTGDRVIMTVPITILKSDLISFNPELPANFQQTISDISVPPGLKVFMEFSERFYPDLLGMGSVIENGNAERIYYDAAFKKDSNKNILALFQVGPEASDLTDLTDDEIIAAVLAQLDEVYDGKASATYMNHVIQNWSKEPYIQGSYTFLEWSQYEATNEMAQGVNDKLYFAGEAYHQQANSTVHGAAFTGRDAVLKIISGA